MATDYSGTPLARKLGNKAGTHAHRINARPDAWVWVALPIAWVDVKVCAVSEVWSGLKLVLRQELR